MSLTLRFGVLGDIKSRDTEILRPDQLIQLPCGVLVYEDTHPDSG